MGEREQEEAEARTEERREEGPRPADAARRALRAARERGTSAEAAPRGPESAESEGKAPRPGDAARAALRRAVAGKGTAVGATAGATAGAAEDSTEDNSEGSTGKNALAQGASEAARPADLAREALRAARAEARRDSPAVGGTESAASVRRPARPAAGVVRCPGEGREPAASGRARDVRELLAGAFRMPSDEEVTSGDVPPADAGQPQGGSRTPASRPAPSPGDSGIRTPRSMAAPRRDSDQRRTFPAFPARRGAADDAAPFAETWWGNAWTTALEEGALDVKRLARGRGYADRGNVDAITVTPGLVLAYVQGSRPRPYRVQIRLRTLDETDWERFLGAAVERPGHIAALLDKELPESLADCGVPLLPGPGDLDPHCSCPDRGHPCKHAAALCYQTARLLDADPFVLLLLRGRGERELLDTLSRRNATRAARAAQEQEAEPLPGVRASDALAVERRLPPIPAPLSAPPHPEQPPAYPSAPGGPDSFVLDQLATDAAARAHALLATGRDEIGELTLWQDAVRLAAARPGSGLTVTTRALYASLASAADRTPAELARAVAAWRQGGLDALAVLEELWDPPAGRFDRARALLLAADLPAFRPWRNHLTHPRGHVQLRFGRDGLWYAYESEPGRNDWWPRGTPDSDPVGALTGLDGSDDF